MRRPTPLLAAVLTALLAASLVLTACGPIASAPDHASDDGSDTQGPTTTVPKLADVTAMADPRSYDGAVQVNLPDPTIVPVDGAPEPQLPTTVTDAQGRTVTVTDDSRILALDLYGTLSHTVFELGLGDHVVGRDTSSAFPEIADRPLVTHNGHELDAEAILQLDPTVVITDNTLGPYDVVLQLEDAGIPVVLVDSHRGLDNLASLTEQVGDALGLHADGVKLGRRLEGDATATETSVDALAPADTTGRLRTIFLYVRGQSGVYYMFGEGSGADSLIDAAGGYDVAKEIGWKGMKPLTDEGLVDAQPDAVLMMTKGLASVGGVDGLLERFPALAQTPAGEHQRIITMDDDQVLSFGPRTSDVIDALAVALYAPDALDASGP